MFRQFDRLIPIFERYECRDFTKFFNDTYKYITKINNPKINIIKLNDKKISFNQQWENKDFNIKK